VREMTEDLLGEARRLLGSLDQGSMSPLAYDTAWVSRLPSPGDPNQPMYPRAYDWLLRHQWPDGSWGGELPYAHDRLISTLSALLTLTASTYREEASRTAVRRAVVYLNRTDLDVEADPAETVGFELVLPELMRQAQLLDLRLPYANWQFVERIQAEKLRRIPPIAVYGGPTTLTTSLEYLGDRAIPSLLNRCQSTNGSWGTSPGATAYGYLQRPNTEAAHYLDRVTNMDTDGGIVFLWPFEVFETAWVLYYLSSLPLTRDDVAPALDRLRAGFTSAGTSWTKADMVPDVDDTAVTMHVLNHFGEPQDTSVFQLYEAAEYFYTFALERNPSVTSNAHVLETIRDYDSTPEHRRMTVKIVHYLRNARIDGRYWIDKWHASPLYAIEQVIRAVAGLDNQFLRPSVEWVLEEQREDGSWGDKQGTMEETALAMKSLMAAAAEDQALRRPILDPLRQAANYLVEHFDEHDHPALWRGKGLYTPHHIVRAIIISALYEWMSNFADVPNG
jgi:halimadienyl-diphosphate synthase